MIIFYFPTSTGTQCETLSPDNIYLLDTAVWIDLFSPTKQEEFLIEDKLNLQIPTKYESNEIEPSSRLYTQKDNLFMTTTMVVMADFPGATTDIVTYILTKNKLITVRYNEFQAFRKFSEKLLNSEIKDATALSILIQLLDATVDRLADILENISQTFDSISQQIFHQSNTTKQKINYKKTLQSIGAKGDLATKVNESLVTLTRLISFLEQVKNTELSKDFRVFLNIVDRDINALREYATFLFNKCNFLLSATFGMVGITQTNTIQIFSVAAVIFLPPTLIASIYGMNFKYMPELNWLLGYPWALILMFFSGWLPYKYFKAKKWF